VLVDADYSQIELRLLAHIADDKAMIEAFGSGEDIHRATASQVFSVPLSEVTPQLRSRAKAVNFGIVYGISAYSLSEDIGVSVKEAQGYIDAYLNHYSGVREYMDNIKEQAQRDGFVSTVYGRRRYLPELKSTNFNVRAFGQRVALNAPIQGTAADIIKIAMIRVFDRLKAENLRARLILQVHDELIVECPRDEVEQVKTLLCQEMENACTLSVKLISEVSVGENWYDAKK
jgi:DNA polymerase-1